jgi:hypothetical protein
VIVSPMVVVWAPTAFDGEQLGHFRMVLGVSCVEFGFKGFPACGTFGHHDLQRRSSANAGLAPRAISVSLGDDGSGRRDRARDGPEEVRM